MSSDQNPFLELIINFSQCTGAAMPVTVSGTGCHKEYNMQVTSLIKLKCYQCVSVQPVTKHWLSVKLYKPCRLLQRRKFFQLCKERVVSPLVDFNILEMRWGLPVRIPCPDRCGRRPSSTVGLIHLKILWKPIPAFEEKNCS